MYYILFCMVALTANTVFTVYGILSYLSLPYSPFLSPVAVSALEAAQDTDGESCVEKAGSLCGLGAVLASSSSSPHGSAPSKVVKQNTSIQSLPDLEFGVASVSNNSRTDSPRSLGLDSDSSHSFREFDQMCSRTIGGTVGSFRTVSKDKEEREKEKNTVLSKEAEEFLSMLPDYRYLVC
jgi:hypothetical protein